MSECVHRVIRKRKDAEMEICSGEIYVCGSCAQMFKVKELCDDPPVPREPMFPKNPVPWGLRPRQA